MTAVMDSRPDYPPTDREFWHKASIRRGKVFDPGTKRWRTLLIPKQSFFQIWPEPSVASAAASESGQAVEPEPSVASAAASESGQAAENDKVGPITKRKGGRPSAKNEIHQCLDRLFAAGKHHMKEMDPMKLAKQVASECGKRLGDAGWARRTVLRHIGSWRAEH
jgi:hypothetical protein